MQFGSIAIVRDGETPQNKVDTQKRDENDYDCNVPKQPEIIEHNTLANNHFVRFDLYFYLFVDALFTNIKRRELCIQ